MALVSLAAVSAWGQSAISARSGMINHVEGQVLLDGQPVDPKFGQFPRVENESILTTQDGRAEVLMTPGVFLRLDENSSFKMLSNHLSDTALEVVSGSAILEVDEMLKDNAITLHFKNGTISLSKRGLYRFDTELSRMRVYDGQADVLVDEKTTTARKGRQVVLGEALVASNFDTNDTDPFYRWASRRAEYISAANVSSARTTGAPSGSGLVSSSYGGPCANYGGLYPNYGSMYSGCGYGSWAWNPYFGMYTYVPGFGYGYSPFGWDFFSPYTVGYAYAPYLYGGTTYGGTTSRLPAVGRVTPPTENNVGRTALTAARSTQPSASPAASAASSASSSSNGSRLGGSGGSVSSGGGGASRGGSAGGGRR
ncbi:MAG TPA: hypothetical protein VIY49_25775 [Bryobacteraceae bacterium]